VTPAKWDLGRIRIKVTTTVMAVDNENTQMIIRVGSEKMEHVEEVTYLINFVFFVTRCCVPLC